VAISEKIHMEAGRRGGEEKQAKRDSRFFLLPAFPSPCESFLSNADAARFAGFHVNGVISATGIDDSSANSGG
jgi:hypothetical protein